MSTPALPRVPWTLHLVVLDPAPLSRAAHYDAWHALGATVTLVRTWDDLRRTLTTQKASVVAVPWHATYAPALAAWVATALPAYRGRLAWWLPPGGAPMAADPPAEVWWPLPLAADRPAADSVAALAAWMQQRPLPAP